MDRAPEVREQRELVRYRHNLGIGNDATIVDLGAGTGTFAVAVARSVGNVVAVDISPVMAVLDSLLESAGFRIIDAQFRRSVYANYTCAVDGWTQVFASGAAPNRRRDARISSPLST